MKQVFPSRTMPSQTAQEILRAARLARGWPFRVLARAFHMACLGSILGAGMAHAQDQDSVPASAGGGDIILPNVTVTGIGASGGIGSTYRNPGNTDIIRSEVDVQPYTIIERQEIENSGATTVEELLKQTLSMSTSVATETASGWTGSSSQINLRGLGASQTLVLINGRRGAGVGSRGTS
ncbi:MAG: TonB-dependent receptor plug domain-containing protein, partial [Azoarcus sp.]|nr:TonB-dependent receptor plug domain-containing protein [Azoarcus sp.]